MHASEKYHARVYANFATQIHITIITTTSFSFYIWTMFLIWSTSCIQRTFKIGYVGLFNILVCDL